MVENDFGVRRRSGGSDVWAMLFSFAVALAWLESVKFMQRRRWIGRRDLARKIVHIGTGPLFMLTWLLFSDEPTARYYAVCVPLSITAKFVLIGSGIVKDEETVVSMSRSGRASELLFGPTLYGIVFMLSTVMYWTDTTTGIVALNLLCFGDGFANIIGVAFGKSNPLPHNRKKSWAGSLGFLVCSFVSAALFLWLFDSFGFLAKMPPGFSVMSYVLDGSLLYVCLAAAIAESLPVSELDNLIVFFVAVWVDRLQK